MHNRFLVLAAVLALAGCPETPPPERTVFDPYQQAVEKAKTIERTLGQAAERRAGEAERATRPLD